jgi:hypothetical protein
VSRYITEALRREVAERANYKCEYCLIPESNSFYAYQIDHIISVKHGGKSERENLAFACPICNRNKGSDLGTVLEQSEDIIRFYNPRKDKWADHFEVSDDGILFPKTLIGEATIKIFGFNHPDSIIERQLLISVGLYP